jgi:hypothetical protein
MLSSNVIAHLCNYNCGLKKLEIKLKKEIENLSWTSLEAVEGKKSIGQPMAPLKE